MASDVPLGPDFIRFLLSTKPKFDCYFVVGNKRQGELERIGAVKLMLMAHSEVFRLELEDSELAEKRDVKVKDIHPGTFKGMLKYVYGHDTTSDMSFDDADNMLYVAEKYMMQMLKNKLAVRLMQLLNPENICSLLNNPACYKHLELNSAITEILRFETNRVLDSPQFLFMNAEGFLKILEQDGLAVTEIELWRAALKWAKNKANSEDGQRLRQEISCFTKNLRLCSLSGDEFLEVVSTPNVLTSSEIGIVSQSIRRKEKPLNLNEISNEILPRKRLNITMKPKFQEMSGFLKQTQSGSITLGDFVRAGKVDCMEYNFTVTTKQNAIELLPLVCWPKEFFRVNCTMTKAVDSHSPDSSSTHEPLITEKFRDRIMYQVPLRVGKDNVMLLPDSKYTFKMKLDVPHHCWKWNRNTRTNDHLTLTIIDYCFPTDNWQYRVIV